MRAAVVWPDGSGAWGPSAIARLEAKGVEVIVAIAPAAAAGRFAGRSIWPAPELLAKLPTPSESLRTAAGASAALIEAHAKTPFDEIHFAAEDGSGWQLALLSRQGKLPGARLIASLPDSVATLLRPLQLGDSIARELERTAIRCSLRDADEVLGPAEVQAALEQAGWTISSPRIAKTPSLPAVTAVVTHKDLSRYLPACLRSLRAQTVPIEIVLVDDGSRPEELRVVEEECLRDPEIRLLQTGGAGVVGARNAGARAASGELVLTVDCDNLMRPQQVEELRNALLSAPGADFATSAFRLFRDGDGAELGFYCPLELTPAALFIANVCGDACAMHRKDALLALGGYRDVSSGCEDWDLWLRYFESGRRGTLVPEVLFDYRVRGDSMLRGRSRIVQLHDNFGVALHHGPLLARLQNDVAVLASSRLQELLDGSRHDGRVESAAELDSLRAQVGERDLLVADARSRGAAALDAERQKNAALAQALVDAQSRAQTLAQTLAASLAAEQLATSEASARATQALRENAELQALLASANAKNRRTEEELAAAVRKQNQLAQERDSLQSALQASQAEVKHFHDALDAMASSSAVRIATMFRAVSPGAHAQVGAVLRKLLQRVSR